MLMPFTVNKKKFNHQRAKRVQSRAIKKAKSNELTNAQAVGDLSKPHLNSHQCRSRSSNPTASISLSKKKERRNKKLAWITQKLVDEPIDNAKSSTMMME